MAPDIITEVKNMLGSLGADEIRSNQALRAHARSLLRLIYGPFADENVIFAQLTGGNA